MNSEKAVQENAEEIEHNFLNWLTLNHKRFANLTEAVVSIMTSLLTDRGVDFLAITGRTKDIQSAVEKVTRKGYNDPQSQMTDIAGVRIIVFFESDVLKVADIIRNSFKVDEKNSSNTDDRMSTDQVGYRSNHFVCDLGQERSALPEFSSIGDLRFEFQVRTVLQHAWAELAHDRNYKFTGTLPRHLERRLFLLAGLLETADQGFDALSASLDEYMKAVSEETAKGELEIEINSVSLAGFLEQWVRQNDIEIQSPRGRVIDGGVLRELDQFGIKTLAQLKEAIPARFVEVTRELNNPSQTYSGLLRRWMYLSDPERFISRVKVAWRPAEVSRAYIREFFPDSANSIINRMLSKASIRTRSSVLRK